MCAVGSANASLALQYKRALATQAPAFPNRRIEADLEELEQRRAPGEVSDLLQRVPELQQLKYSVQAVADKGWLLPASTKVKLYAFAGLTYYRHAGATAAAAKVTTKLFGGKGCHAVAVRAEGHKAGNRVEWFADVLAFVSFEEVGGRMSETLAFVKWYEDDLKATDAVRELHMTPLKHSRQVRPQADGRSQTVDFTDLIVMRDILYPVYIQENVVQCTPLHKKYLYNRFVV